MIPVKVVALLCSLASPDNCHWQTVTTSDFSDVSAQGCKVGMPQLAEFMSHYPAHFLKRWRCEEGNVPERERT